MFLILTLGVLTGCGPSDATIKSNVKATLAADSTAGTAPNRSEGTETRILLPPKQVEDTF